MTSRREGRSIGPDGAPQRWTAIYWRFYRLYEDASFSSLADAWLFLTSGEADGTLSGVAVRTPEGAEIPHTSDEPPVAHENAGAPTLPGDAR